jgi:SWI/SNF-related matrix-associated actin-dependent regulator 1 of chromatin subfamily A
MSAYRITGESKIEGVCEFIETLAENGAKFLVFAHHIDMLDALEKFV